MAVVLVGAAVTGRGDAQQLGGLQALQTPSNPTPAQEAAAHGLPQCAPIIDKMMGNTVLTPNYTQSSMWRTQDPGKHIFQSIIGLSMPTVPPDTFATLVTAPTGSGTCDGVAVQVIPLNADCGTAENRVKSGGGSTIFPLQGTKVMVDANRDRLMLLPGANGTCIAISVKSFFAGDP